MNSNSKLSFGEKLAYGVGDAGCNFIWTTVSAFLTLYYTDSVGITAGVVGTIMMVTRLLDGVSDLFMGTLIDRTNTRWGKARPWIAFTAPLMAIGLFLLFNVPSNFSLTGKTVYAFVTYVLLAVVIYTACNLAYSTLMSLMSSNPEERTSLSAIRFFCTVIAVLIIVYSANGIIAKSGYRGLSILFGVVGMLLLFITFFFTKERTSGEENADVNSTKCSLSVKESFKILFKNKYFIFVALLFIVNYAAMNASNGITIYYCRDILGDITKYGTVNAVGFLPALIALPVYPKIAAIFGKWKTLVAGYIIEIIGFGIIILAGSNYPMMIFGLFIKGIGTIPHQAGLFAMVGDIVDYSEWKHGKRIDGLTYSATSFGMKVGTGIGSASVGWSLALGGYDGSAAVQSASALFSIKAVFIFLPIVLILIGFAILLMCNLDKFLPQMHADLEQRRKNS